MENDLELKFLVFVCCLFSNVKCQMSNVKCCGVVFKDFSSMCNCCLDGINGIFSLLSIKKVRYFTCIRRSGTGRTWQSRTWCVHCVFIVCSLCVHFQYFGGGNGGFNGWNPNVFCKNFVSSQNVFLLLLFCLVMGMKYWLSNKTQKNRNTWMDIRWIRTIGINTYGFNVWI